jgi:hypothetical protein
MKREGGGTRGAEPSGAGREPREAREPAERLRGEVRPVYDALG